MSRNLGIVTRPESCDPSYSLCSSFPVHGYPRSISIPQSLGPLARYTCSDVITTRVPTQGTGAPGGFVLSIAFTIP